MVAMVFGGAPPDALGLIPSFLDERDKRPMREQFDENYRHGGGWKPIKGFSHVGKYVIQYPDDPPLEPIGAIKLRDEIALLYPHAFVAIFQKDRSFEVARMD